MRSLFFIATIAALVPVLRVYPETWMTTRNTYVWCVVAGVCAIPLTLGGSAAPVFVLVAALLACLGAWGPWHMYNSGGDSWYRPRFGLPGVDPAWHGATVAAIGLACFAGSWMRHLGARPRMLRPHYVLCAVGFAAILALGVVDLEQIGAHDDWSGPGLRMSFIGGFTGLVAAAWCAWRVDESSTGRPAPTRYEAGGIAAAVAMIGVVHLPFLEYPEPGMYWSTVLDEARLLVPMGLAATVLLGAASRSSSPRLSRTAAVGAIGAFGVAIWITFTAVKRFAGRWPPDGETAVLGIGAYLAAFLSAAGLLCAVPVAMRGGSCTRWAPPRAPSPALPEPKPTPAAEM